MLEEFATLSVIGTSVACHVLGIRCYCALQLTFDLAAQFVRVHKCWHVVAGNDASTCGEIIVRVVVVSSCNSYTISPCKTTFAFDLRCLTCNTKPLKAS